MNLDDGMFVCDIDDGVSWVDVSRFFGASWIDVSRFFKKKKETKEKFGVQVDESKESLRVIQKETKSWQLIQTENFRMYVDEPDKFVDQCGKWMLFFEFDFNHKRRIEFARSLVSHNISIEQLKEKFGMYGIQNEKIKKLRKRIVCVRVSSLKEALLYSHLNLVIEFFVDWKELGIKKVYDVGNLLISLFFDGQENKSIKSTLYFKCQNLVYNRRGRNSMLELPIPNSCAKYTRRNR